MTKIIITDGENTKEMEGTCGIAFVLSTDEEDGKPRSTTTILGAGRAIDIATVATDCFVGLIKQLGQGDDMLQSAINLITIMRFCDGMYGEGNTYEDEGEENFNG